MVNTLTSWTSPFNGELTVFRFQCANSPFHAKKNLRKNIYPNKWFIVSRIWDFGQV